MTQPRTGRLWITRTLPQAQATADRLRALGWDPVVAPVLEARALTAAACGLDAPEALAGFDALALTSQAALAAFCALRPERDLPVFAVGEATGRAALAAGFGQVRWGDPDAPDLGGDVAALAERIAAASPRPVQVLNPTARRPAADLVALLASRGVPARAVVVYETVPTPPTPPPDDLVGVLVHSARAATETALRLDPRRGEGLTFWVLSEAVAKPLRARGFRRIVVARQPTEAALIGQIDEGRFSD